MISHGHSLSRACPGLLAVLALVFLAGDAPAENFVFRNDCKSPVVVQATCVFRGVLRRSRPYLLKPGARTPSLSLLGDKILTVYDGKVPNRVLYTGTFMASPTSRTIQILPGEPGGPAVRVRAQERSMNR